MNEIEKMMQNAGVKKINTHQSEIDNGDPRFTGISHSDSYIKYPPFTAEKQLELIKWFMHSEHFSPVRFNAQWVVDDIASYINFLWQVLTPEEKQQIKEILK